MKSDFMIFGGKMSTTLKMSRIQKRGQVTIPVEIRQKLHLEEGDLVAFIETKEGVVLSPQQVVPASSHQAGPLGGLGGKPTSAAEGPSIVEQTAGIFRQRQDGQKGAIDFEQARQAFIEHLAQQTRHETLDSQT